MGFALTIIILVVALGLAWRYLGSYMAAVFDGRVHFLWLGGAAGLPAARHGPGAGAVLEALRRRRWSSSRPSRWAFTYLLIRIQGSLPLNPQHLGAVNAGAQLQHGRVVPDQHQLAELRRRDDHVVLLADRRPDRAAVRQRRPSASPWPSPWCAGFSRRNSPTIGNFWVDITRCILYILLPIAFVAGIIVVGQGAVQTLAGPVLDPRRAERRHPDHRPWSDRLHGRDHAAWDERRRVLQRRPRPPSREPDRVDQLAVHLPHPLHPLRPHLHLRQDGGQHPPRRRPAGRHGDHLRRLGRLHQLRRAPAQPGRGPAAGCTQTRREHRWARRCASATRAAPCSTSR